MSAKNQLKRGLRKLIKRILSGREKLSRLTKRVRRLRRDLSRAERKAGGWQQQRIPSKLIKRIEAERRAGKHKQDNCGDCPFRLIRSGKARRWSDLDKLKAKRSSCGNCPSRALRKALEESD